MSEWFIHDETSSKEQQLAQWWRDVAESEVEMVVEKTMEYGGNGQARDLVDIGRELAELMGKPDVGNEEATELGIYFYLKGKFSRWTAALLEGRDVSDDTLKDIGVYIRMAQRNREVGGWPFGDGE